MAEIIAIDTPTLGDRGYLATDGEVALVVDAQRDFDRIITLATERGVAITHVFETHMHNDYVTGGFSLAREVGARYLVNGADPVSFERTPVADGDLVEVGQMRVRVIGTPGHTFTHLSYALLAADPDGGRNGRSGGGIGEVVAAFTGGSLLNGSTGRTDLLGPDHVRALSQAQHDSAHRLARELPGGTVLYPTHGFGSFCAATPGTGAPSTIAQEQSTNPALTLPSGQYVDQLLAGLDAYPSYYAHMAPANLAGPAAPDLSAPRRAEPAEVRRRIDAGEWVVDLRARSAFAAGHLHGALNFGADGSLATYLGWLLPWGMPLTLIGATAQDVALAQRELCRIGIDRIAAAASGSAERWAAGERLESFGTARFRDLAAQAGNGAVVVLDVRRRGEWEESHIEGAVHIPLHELARRMGEVGDGEVWVHCHSGYRAAIAASMLAAAGRDVVAVDDDFSAAQESGMTQPARALTQQDTV
jgi:hydroxyacylglutathione hydrolase